MSLPVARVAAVTLLSVMAASTAPMLLAEESVEARLDNIERKLGSRGLLDLLNRVEQIQRDLQLLRGDVEVQTHTVQESQRRSRERYIDIDRRLQQLETGQAEHAPVLPAPVMPAPVIPAPVISAAEPPTQASAPTATAPVAPLAPDPVTPVTPGPPQVMVPSTPAPVPVAPAEREAYNTSLAVLREGRYPDAVTAFNTFLATYPASSYADNASYWLGETYYVTRDFDRALQTFEGMAERYPRSSKVPDSRLKIGYIYYEKKDWPASRQALEAVVNSYLGSTAARLAADRLARMKKEGR